MPIRQCLTCNNDFFVHQWRLNSTKTKRGQYCSVTCRTKGQVGDKAAHWQGGDKETDCIICGKHFPYKYNANRNRRFCSIECTSFWRHLELTGERNGNYIDGRSAKRGLKHLTYEYRMWHKQLLATEKSCRKCGGTNRLETDHIVPISIDEGKAFSMANGQVLCYDCHRLKTSSDRKDIAAHKRNLKKYGIKERTQRYI